MRNYENMILKIESYLKTIPEDYEINIGLVGEGLSEIEVKLHFDLPKFWLFVNFYKSDRRNLSPTRLCDYFLRKGYTPNHLGSIANNRKNIYFFAIPKHLTKK